MVDCGLVVHPDTARQQAEGPIVMALSAAIGEQTIWRGGAVQQPNFTIHPILTLARMVFIDIHVIGGDQILGSLGEPALPPVAPALANALFVATGKRVRQPPLAQAFRSG